jgi:predicted dehydrogenase
MSAIPRRQFLASTAAAASAMAVWSASETQAADSPGETVVLGVMGVNGRGGALAKNFAAQSGARVAYVCDVDQRAIDRVNSTVSGVQSKAPEGVVDFRRILDDKAVDALVIAAPDHWHAPATILACAHGKHVYCEKPACHNPREGELMVEAARKHNRKVQLGTQRRSSPGCAEAVERVKNGEIGKVLFARGWINSTRPNIKYGKAEPVPKWLDYALWQGPAPEREYKDNIIHYNWHWFWHWGTGELGNNGVHAIDICRWGLQVDYPERVVCGGGKFHFNDDQETPDTQIATFHFGDKAINWEHRTWSKRGFEGATWGVTFYGEKGALVMGEKNHYAVYDMEGRELDHKPQPTGEIIHLTNFLDGIRKDAKLNQEIEEGVKSTLLCLLGNIAYRTGTTVDFDPKTKKIVNNPAADKLWSREYRPGWEPKV